MSERMDYGKPGDPSGCYFPREWRSPGAKVGYENREAVRQFFAAHIGCSNVECAKALDAITTRVLGYRPKEKGVTATKMRKQIEKAERKAKREERE